MSPKLASQARSLAFHGSVLLLLSFVAGFLYSQALGGNGDAQAWRLAHMEALLNGMLMLLVACGYSLISPSLLQEKLIRIGLLVTGYSNLLASGYGGFTGGHGGTSPGDAASIHDWIVFLGFMPGVIGAFVAIGTFALCLRGRRTD